MPDQGVFVPVVPDDNDLLLGEGIWYINFIDGESSEPILGATRGGCKVEIDKIIRDMMYDGAYGPTFDLRRYERYVPRFMINLLKMTYTSLTYGTVSDSTDQGNYHEIAFRLNIEDSDYLTNVTFVGKKHDGTDCIIIIKNVLNDGNISFDFKEKDEIVTEMQYTGHYLRTTPTVPPIEIWEYKAA